MTTSACCDLRLPLGLQYLVLAFGLLRSVDFAWFVTKTTLGNNPKATTKLLHAVYINYICPQLTFSVTNINVKQTPSFVFVCHINFHILLTTQKIYA